MRSLKKNLLFVISSIILIVAIIGIILEVIHFPQQGTSLSQRSTEGLYVLKNNDKRSSKIELTKLKIKVKPEENAPTDNIREILLSNDKNRWIVAGKLLSNLKTSELWDVLNSPLISDQIEAKAMRLQLLKACIPVLKQVANSRQTNRSLVTDACSDLSKAGDISYFASEYMKLNSDQSFQLSDYRIPIEDPKSLNSDEIQAEWDLAEDQIANSNDPYIVSAAIRHLWWTQSPDIYSDWNEIHALTLGQQDQLMQVIATDVPCTMIGGCGPNSPWTINFCVLVPGTVCPPGLSYEQIVNLNLTQVQLELRQRIWTTISHSSLFH